LRLIDKETRIDHHPRPVPPFPVVRMIVTCPACQTRYRVDDAAIGLGGRTVRCASCGHLWHYARERETVAAAAAPAPAPPKEAMSAAPPLRIEPPSEAGTAPPAPVVPPRPVSAEPMPPRSRRWGAGLAWAALILILAAIVLVALLARDQVVAIWPDAARVYAMAHLGAEEPAKGLEIKVMPSRTADSLVIDGDINNTAGTARKVPKLRVALRDANKKELDAKVIDPPVERLLPGATAHFSTSFEHPNPNAAGVAVTFVTG
jgi:predicted Zn finger-like uncharacterized protein